jgi:hypothetical protein
MEKQSSATKRNVATFVKSLPFSFKSFDRPITAAYCDASARALGGCHLTLRMTLSRNCIV